jgi:hypothetical protein
MQFILIFILNINVHLKLLQKTTFLQSKMALFVKYELKYREIIFLIKVSYKIIQNKSD